MRSGGMPSWEKKPARPTAALLAVLGAVIEPESAGFPEFDALWNNPDAVFLADFVLEDVGRLADRKVIPNVQVWRKEPEPAAGIIETPVYRREFGLWEHQKYFIQRAFEAHQGPHGARFVLADMVGLGKTLQLALSAMLMALYGDKPILVLAPKTLLWPWIASVPHTTGTLMAISVAMEAS